jgi:vanillate O-demethylase monooxygenase subunit
MGDPAKADPALICLSVGPGDPDWNMKTDKTRIDADYRLEIANLMDLSHITWTHRKTFGGTRAYADTRPTHTLTARGIDTRFVLRGVPVPIFAQHMFPPGMLFDLDFDIQMTLPCNFVLHFKVSIADEATEGPPAGPVVLDSYSCQAVTPRDEDSVDYYYSWGPSRATDAPGLSDLLHEAINDAFLEDKATLEAQHRNLRSRPDAPQVNIKLDAGPGKMLWVLDRFLKEEQQPLTAEPGERPEVAEREPVRA